MATILTLPDKYPQISADTFLALTATIIGDVTIATGASVWYGAVLRGDNNPIVIGARTSVQDNVVIHCNDRHGTLIGADVTIGHAAVLEGCVVEDGALIGMNATVLDGAHVGAGAVVAAGTVVRENFVVPAGMIVAGVPGRVVGGVSAELAARLIAAPRHYLTTSTQHRAAQSLT
jgi:carbonic anhydrase/acetyltransferase-like protein (isoleucine patch superfamily)